MAQPTEPTNRQGSQPWAHGRLRRPIAGLVTAAALWLAAAGTAFADHHAEQVDFHPGRPGHDHEANHHGTP